MTKASALAFHEGLSAELRSKAHGFNAPEIKLTCVHPTWAATAMIAPHRKTIDSSGMAVIEPEVVANAVVKQVLSGRGRQIILAPGAEPIATVRAWPSWISGGLGAVAGKISFYFLLLAFGKAHLLTLMCVQSRLQVDAEATTLSPEDCNACHLMCIRCSHRLDFWPFLQLDLNWPLSLGLERESF